MSVMGYVALVLGFLCLAVLINDLAQRRTLFAQLDARRNARGSLFWLGIAGWAACLLGCMLVVLEDRGRQFCGSEDSCKIMIQVAP